MSIEVELTLEDYQTILNWYELAFAKNTNQSRNDTDLFKKLYVMCQAKIQEIRNEDRLSD